MACNQPVLKRLAVLLFALLATACASLGKYQEAPRVLLVNIQPLDMTLFEQRFAVQLRVMDGVLLKTWPSINPPPALAGWLTWQSPQLVWQLAQ